VCIHKILPEAKIELATQFAFTHMVEHFHEAWKKMKLQLAQNGVMPMLTTLLKLLYL
jgi:hypothetical protein